MQISVYRDWLKCPITTQTVVFQVANQTASYCMTKTKQNNPPPPQQATGYDEHSVRPKE